MPAYELQTGEKYCLTLPFGSKKSEMDISLLGVGGLREKRTREKAEDALGVFHEVKAASSDKALQRKAEHVVNTKTNTSAFPCPPHDTSMSVRHTD